MRLRTRWRSGRDTVRLRARRRSGRVLSVRVLGGGGTGGLRRRHIVGVRNLGVRRVDHGINCCEGSVDFLCRDKIPTFVGMRFEHKAPASLFDLVKWRSVRKAKSGVVLRETRHFVVVVII